MRMKRSHPDEHDDGRQPQDRHRSRALNERHVFRAGHNEALERPADADMSEGILRASRAPAPHTHIFIVGRRRARSSEKTKNLDPAVSGTNPPPSSLRMGRRSSCPFVIPSQSLVNPKTHWLQSCYIGLGGMAIGQSPFSRATERFATGDGSAIRWRPCRTRFVTKSV